MNSQGNRQIARGTVPTPRRGGSSWRPARAGHGLTFGRWLAVLFIATAAPSGLEATQRFPRLGTVTGSQVRVRTGPSGNHFAFTTLPRDTSVIVQGEKDKWYAIHLPPYRTCWIHRDFVNSMSGDRDRVVVTGERVALRCTPNTKYRWIGRVGRGQTLRLTGKEKVDEESGAWVECYAPLAAEVYVSKEFTELGNPIDPSQVAILFRGLRPAGTAVAGEPKVGAPGEAGSSELPSLFSSRLTEIHEAVEREKQKPVVAWDFGKILTDLKAIRESSEDLGEIRLAEKWISQIEKQILPLQKDLIELEKRQLAARRGVGSHMEKDKELAKAIHRDPSRSESKYLAVGWVVGLAEGKKVEGTHMIKKGNRLLFYLKSDTFDLDKYVNKRIGVQGTLEERPGTGVIEVTGVQVLSD